MTLRKTALPALAMALAAIVPALAAPRAVLDYRKPAPEKPPVVAAHVRAELAKAMGEQVKPDALVVLGHGRGSLSGKGGMEDIYLIGDRTPAAADRGPDGASQRLVAVSGGKAIASYVLPKDVRYQRIAGLVDSDGDGRSEVLLETSFYNMGQSVTSVDLVAPAGGNAAEIRQSLREVAYDGCDNPAGKRERRASTIALGDDGRLVARSHALSCR